jgi:hypothetical protein
MTTVPWARDHNAPPGVDRIIEVAFVRELDGLLGLGGSEVFADITGSVSGSSVTITTTYTPNFDEGYVATFLGTVDSSGLSMSGTWTSNKDQSGTWTATTTGFTISGTLSSTNCAATCSTTPSTPTPVPDVAVDVTSDDGGGVSTSDTSDDDGDWSVDVPAGGYTVTPEGDGWNPDSQSVTVTDADVSGVDFSQCQSGDDSSSLRFGAPLATTAATASPHCTKTKLTCYATYFPDPGYCSVVVTDISQKPTAPTVPSGTVNVVASTGAPGFGIPLPGHRFLGTLTTTLTLEHTKSTNSAIALLYLISAPGTYTVTAKYVPSSSHKASSDSTTFLVRPEPQVSIKTELNLQGPVLQELGTYEQAVGSAAIIKGGAGAFTSPPQKTLAYLVGGTSGVAWGAITTGIGQLELRLATFLNDPPDAAYRTVAVPHVPRTPDLPAGTSPVLRTVHALLVNAVTFRAVSSVVGTAINRATSAGQAGDVAAKDKQVLAATADLDRLARIISDNISVQRKVVVLLGRAHIGTLPLARSSGRLPALTTTILKLLGLTPGQIAQAQSKAAATRLPATVDVASLFVNASLINSEHNEAAALLQFAADPAPQAFVGLPSVYP